MASPPLETVRRALVVDANPFGLGLVRDVLIRHGIGEVDEAQDGAEAVGSLGDHRPDLVVLDWDIPVISAREILAIAGDRTGPGRGPIPVLVTMSRPTRSAVEAALKAGASGILAAPFSPGELRRRLTRMLPKAAA